MLTLDHVVIAVGYDLEQAITNYRALGFSVVYGGVHASGATHNALIWFPDSTFIELLAVTGNDAKPGVIDYASLVRGGEGLVGYALRSNDLDADTAKMRSRGAAVGDPVESGRLRPDGVRLAWKNALVDNGFAPFLIQYLSPPDAQRVPSDPHLITHRNGIEKLCSVDFARKTVTLKAPQPISFDPTKTYGVDFRIEAACS